MDEAWGGTESVNWADNDWLLFFTWSILILSILVLLNCHVDECFEAIRWLWCRDIRLGTTLLWNRLMHVYSAWKTIRKVIYEVVGWSTAPFRGLARNLTPMCHISEWPHRLFKHIDVFLELFGRHYNVDEFLVNSYVGHTHSDDTPMEHDRKHTSIRVV